MYRTTAALKACTALVVTAILATGCGATTTTDTASSQATVTTTVTTKQTTAATPTATATASQPAALVSIPPKKLATVVPTTKAPSKKPTTKHTTTKPKPRPVKTSTTPSKPKPTKPKPTKKPKPSVYYANCAAVRADGAAPIYRGDPGYSSKLDRDGDGVACEN